MFTIGHSNLPIESFLRALKENDVRLLVDVRRMPRSRFNPQFNREALAQSLTAEGIAYQHAEALGGMRTAVAGSVNTAFPPESFRGYADHMQTPEFQRALDALQAEPAFGRMAVMCAEGKPSQCHRQLIADAMLARGVPVQHILVAKDGASRREAAAFTKFARVEGTRVWYPAPDAPQRVLFVE